MVVLIRSRGSSINCYGSYPPFTGILRRVASPTADDRLLLAKTYSCNIPMRLGFDVNKSRTNLLCAYILDMSHASRYVTAERYDLPELNSHYKTGSQAPGLGARSTREE